MANVIKERLQLEYNELALLKKFLLQFMNVLDTPSEKTAIIHSELCFLSQEVPEKMVFWQKELDLVMSIVQDVKDNNATPYNAFKVLQKLYLQVNEGLSYFKVSELFS